MVGGGGGLFPGTSHKLAAPQIDNLMQATPLPFPSLLPTAKLGPPPQAMAQTKKNLNEITHKLHPQHVLHPYPSPLHARE